MTFETFPVLIAAMSAWKADHPLVSILSSDSPSLTIGYISMNDEFVVWDIKLSKVIDCCYNPWKSLNASRRRALIDMLMDPKFILDLHSHINQCENCLPAYVLMM